jgi:hypothetical protein
MFEAVADVMRQTRAQYYHAIRFINRNREYIVNERFANALAANNDRCFWHEAKRIRSTKRCRGNTVDGVSSSSDIAQLFASKFEDLYTSVPYDGDDVISIRKIINDDLRSISYNNDYVILPADVQAAIDRLKPGKNDGGIGLTSDHFKFACHDLSVHIAFLFSSLLVHDVVPRDLSLNSVIPIPKGKNVNLTAAVNYRGITLRSILIKIFDLIILSRFSDKLYACDLQLVSNLAGPLICVPCMLLKETIVYYTINDGPV